MDTIGRYKIVKELGRGAMGAVYKAMDPQIDRTVAVKVILTSNLSPKDLENYKQRFYREARAAGKMSHGGIVTIYDITEDAKGQPYLVMEFVEGRTLEQIMDGLAARGEKMPVAQAIEIATQVADALDYAHRRGVVHRDIKPANILLTDDGAPKIADFGIAKMEGVQLTQTGHMLGTPAFMSPEQFSGGTIDGRTDLFSLGSILYWMLAGEKPFYAETLSMVTYNVVFANPRPPSEIHAAVPSDADIVVERCLAKKLEVRYATCKDLADDLRALAGGRPVKAKALTEAERTVIAPVVPPATSSVADVEKTTALPAAKLERTAAVVASSPEKAVAAVTPAKVVAKKPGKKKSVVARILVAAAVLLLVLYGARAWLDGQFTQEPPATVHIGKGNEPKVSRPAPQPSPTPPPPVTEPAAEQPIGPPAETKEPAKEPETTPAEQPKDEPVAKPETELRSGPPPWSKGKGNRNRRQASTARATLVVECAHNFRDGILEISTGGDTVLRASLRGKEQSLGVVKVYSGVYRARVDIPAGEHFFEVKARSALNKYTDSDEIGGAFAKDGSRTMLIDFGKGSGIGVFNRKMNLRWK